MPVNHPRSDNSAALHLSSTCRNFSLATNSYFWHPQSQYFGVGRVGRDQVEDYAHRKGVDAAEMERWLAANLGYER